MKWLKRKLFKALFVVVCVVALVKTGQTICWRNNLTSPSFESSDPHERVEAAWQAAKKFGGKQ